MGKFYTRRSLFLALALVALLSTTACSENETTETDRTQNFVEGTLSASSSSGTTGYSTITGGTTGAPSPDALLRLEGDTKVTFSGICTVGNEQSVLSGKVPKRYRFELNDENLSCRIQKRDPGSGNLRVVLLSGSNTRSVQQTNSTNNIVRLSYRG